MADEPGEIRLRIRVWLPDRPGALGLVASRIGSLGADIVGIDVLERGENVAVDEFFVVLSNGSLLDLLIREVGEVDGAKVEQFVIVETFSDPRLDGLVTVEALLDSDELDKTLVDRVAEEFGADWAGVIRSGVVAATAGTAPETSNLLALAAGTSASPLVAAGRVGPDDLLVAPLGDGSSLLVGRETPPFRARERLQLLALGRIVTRLP